MRILRLIRRGRALSSSANCTSLRCAAFVDGAASHSPALPTCPLHRERETQREKETQRQMQEREPPTGAANALRCALCTLRS